MGDGVYIGDGPLTLCGQCIRVVRWISAIIIHEDVSDEMRYKAR